jgi:hypothetical protein
MTTWFFTPRGLMHKDRDPVLGEFFTTDSIKTTADSIVRESIQNSIDANSGSGPVVVRFAVGRASRAETEDLFSGLWEHVGASDEGAGLLSAENNFRYVTVEDFGTTGLRGDPEDVMGNAGDKENEFYFFVRAEGKSSKSGATRGSWGVGKYTYLDASMINAMFVLTARGGNGPVGGNGPLAIGMAVLKNHRLENPHGPSDIYTPDGYLAEVRPLTGGDYAGEDAILPFGADSDMPERIRAAFNLQRRDEPGLSVVVPYVPAELTYDELVRSVARNYGILIGSGELAVTVVDETGNETTLDSDSIRAVLEGLEASPERQELIDELSLALWGAGLTAENRTELGEHPLENMPSWQTDVLMTEEQAKTIRDALTSGQNLAVRVPIPITPHADAVTRWSYLDVFFGPSETKRTKPHFYRQGLRISEIKSESVSGLRSLVIINDPELAAFLGAAEGVSHVDWSATTARFVGKYAYGQNWLAFVKGAPHQILRRARSAEEDEDLDLASDYFSIPDDEDGPVLPPPVTPPEPPEGCGPVVPPPPPPPPRRPRRYRIEPLGDGGFSVTATREVPKGAVLTIGVAYDIPGGNPIKNWQPADFRLDYMTVEIEGGDLVEKSDNKIQARSTGNEGLKVKVQGFDPQRDLFVEASLSEDN